MSLLSMLRGKGPNGFGYGSTAEEVSDGIDLRGRTMLVTGCNSGLGRETVRVLALRGARVIGTGRTVEKARAGLTGLKTSADPLALACDLSEPGSVRACIVALARDGARLDAIICNAGIMALPEARQVHGIELQLFTNHVGHFMLVNGLLDQLTAAGRVVVVSSNAHRRAPAAGIEFDNLSGARDYKPWRAYGQSKLANILFTKQLARRLGDGGRTANTLHPGVISTNLGRSLPGVGRLALRVGTPLFMKDVQQGAATQVYLATNPGVARVTGQYFSDCDRAEPTPIATDAGLAARLWETTERIVAQLP